MAGLCVPLSTLRPEPCGPRRMTEGPGGLLDLSGTALASATPCRFYPGAFVAVGTALTGGPPHGSVREELPHTALALGNDEQTLGRLSYLRQSNDTLIRLRVRCAACCWSVSLGRSPSLHRLRCRQRAGIVRLLRRYYEIVRLPSIVHVGSTATGLFRPSRSTIGRGSCWGLPVLAHRVSTHAQGLRLRGARKPLA